MSLRALLRLVATVPVLMVVLMTAGTLVARAAGWQTAVVVSGSMSPAVDPGDVVLYSACPAGGVVPGLILLAADPHHPGSLLTHRVRSVRDTGEIVTKGDANPTSDSTPLRADQVHGCARLVVPYIGLPRLVLDAEQRHRALPFAALVLLSAWFALPRARRSGGRHAAGASRIRHLPHGRVGLP